MFKSVVAIVLMILVLGGIIFLGYNLTKNKGEEAEHNMEQMGK